MSRLTSLSPSMRHAASIACLTALFVAVPLAQTQPVESPALHALAVGGQVLSVELAASPEQRSAGLSKRKTLEPDRGMLFIFADEARRSFWMRDTYIALDLAYARSDGTITQIVTMEPEDDPRVPTRVYRSIAPAQFVLEVNKGWFAMAGVGVGDRIEIDETIRALVEK